MKLIIVMWHWRQGQSWWSRGVCNWFVRTKSENCSCPCTGSGWVLWGWGRGLVNDWGWDSRLEEWPWGRGWMGRCVYALSKLGKLKWAWSVFSGDTKRGACNDRACRSVVPMGSRVRVGGGKGQECLEYNGMEGNWQLVKWVSLCVSCVLDVCVCKVDQGGIYRDYLTYCYWGWAEWVPSWADSSSCTGSCTELRQRSFVIRALQSRSKSSGWSLKKQFGSTVEGEWRWRGLTGCDIGRDRVRRGLTNDFARDEQQHRPKSDLAGFRWEALVCVYI